jgi:hypothetical protein
MKIAPPFSLCGIDRSFVMAGLCPGHPRLPAVHAKKDVDARHRAGHDEMRDFAD